MTMNTPLVGVRRVSLQPDASNSLLNCCWLRSLPSPNDTIITRSELCLQQHQQQQ